MPYPKTQLDFDDNMAVVVLAAGEGSRIGMPKWQVEYEGKTFLEIIHEKLKNSFPSEIICVKRASFDIRHEGFLYVDNITPEFGMISSLYYAFKAYPDFRGYMIFPVDHPFIEVSTIIGLKKAFEANPSKIIRPTHNGIPGHPIIIPNSLVSYLGTPDYEGGLRALIKNTNIALADVPFNDPNVLKNVNFISDLT